MKESDFIGSMSGEVRWATNGAYYFFNPKNLPLNMEIDSETNNKFINAAMSLARLDGIMSLMTKDELKLLMRAFTSKESTSSSSIEGTMSTLEDLYRSERIVEKNHQKAEDIQEVNNYKKALQWGFEILNEGKKIDMDFIKELHNILMDGVRGSNKSPGEFKVEQNAIGSFNDTIETAKFVPASPESVDYLMENWIQYIYSEDNIMLNVAITHYQFEVIHPFRDGNGRLGRLLIVFILQSKGVLHYPALYLSEYFNMYRNRYIDCLFNVSSRDMFKEWFIFLMEGFTTQAEDSVMMIDELWKYRRLLIDKEKNANVIHTIELLFQNPYIRAKDISEGLRVSFPSALDIIRTLERQGIIREVTGMLRNRVYLADGIMEILNKTWVFSKE